MPEMLCKKLVYAAAAEGQICLVPFDFELSRSFLFYDTDFGSAAAKMNDVIRLLCDHV